MACGGTTTHIDFAFVRPGTDRRLPEQRQARWAGHSHVDYSFHVTLCGALPLAVFAEMRDAIAAGFLSFKVFTTDILPPHPKRPSFRLDFGRIQLAMAEAARHGGLVTVHAEDDELVQTGYERFRAEGRLDGANMHLVHTKLSEQLAFGRTIGLGRATGAGIYFVHTSAREGSRPSRRRGRPASPSTRRRSTSTRASTPSTTRHRAVSAPTRTPRSSCRRIGRRSGTGWWPATSRPWRPTSTRRASR